MRGGVDFKCLVGVVAAHSHGWLSGATMLKSKQAKGVLAVGRTSQVGRGSGKHINVGTIWLNRHVRTTNRDITMANYLREAWYRRECVTEAHVDSLW